MYNPLIDALYKIRVALQIISCVYDLVDELILNVDIARFCNRGEKCAIINVVELSLMLRRYCQTFYYLTKIV